MTTPSAPPMDETIQRVLFVCPKTHIYAIPPLRSTKGYQATTWTNPAPGDPQPAREIFTARLRVLETATPIRKRPSSNAHLSRIQKNGIGDPGGTIENGDEDDDDDEDQGETITVSILLEDPATGDLFAEAPYTSTTVVEPAVDSSRFFAIRVVGPSSSSNGSKGGSGGATMTATLGLGFEDRAESMEFGICLQGCGKVLGLNSTTKNNRKGIASALGALGFGKEKKPDETAATVQAGPKKDWSLKDGQSITVNVGGKGTGSSSRRKEGSAMEGEDASAAKSALFSIPPPPPAPSSSSSTTLPSTGASTNAPTKESTIPLLAPPPAAPTSRAEKRRSRELASISSSTTVPAAPVGRPSSTTATKSEAEALGFDDGEFGEFQ